jgi:Transposase DDE domain
MRRPQYTITSRAIHEHAATLCQKHLRLKDHGPKCTAFTLLTLLFYAAARLTSMAAVCASLAQAPSDTAVRTALLATLPEINELQRRLNRGLQGDLPKALRRRRQPLAIDLTLLPYHGEPWADANEVYRSQAKDGTSHFHAYATAYVLRKGQRYTVALVYVHKGDDLAAVVKELLRQAAKAGVRPRYVLLDRGFYQVSVIRYLQAARYPFLMPAPAKGRKADHPQGPSGTRLPPPQTRRLVTLHADGQRRPQGDGVDLREVPQPARRAEETRTPGAGVCLLGSDAFEWPVGV